MPSTANHRTAITPRRLETVTIDLASVAANTTAEQSVSLSWVRTDMFLLVKGNSLPAGLAIVNAHCEANGTLILTMLNATGSPINASSQEFEVLAL